MRCGDAGSAERCGPRHHLGMAHRPLVGLPRAHRPPGDQRDRRDAEFLGDQPVLRFDLVIERDRRKARAVIGGRGVRRGGRQTIAQHVRDDDEHRGGIEDTPRADEPLVVGVPAGIPGRVDDDVGLVGVERPVGLVGQPGITQRESALQGEVAECEVFGVLRCRHQLLTAHCPRSIRCGGVLDGRTSMSKMAVGIYSVAHELGTSTTPDILPSTGAAPRIR